jgi:hypothetical protein
VWSTYERFLLCGKRIELAGRSGLWHLQHTAWLLWSQGKVFQYLTSLVLWNILVSGQSDGQNSLIDTSWKAPTLKTFPATTVGLLWVSLGRNAVTVEARVKLAMDLGCCCFTYATCFVGEQG